MARKVKTKPIYVAPRLTVVGSLAKLVVQAPALGARTERALVPVVAPGTLVPVPGRRTLH